MLRFFLKLEYDGNKRLKRRLTVNQIHFAMQLGGVQTVHISVILTVKQNSDPENLSSISGVRVRDFDWKV